jgi:hypothetical protein
MALVLARLPKDFMSVDTIWLTQVSKCLPECDERTTLGRLYRTFSSVSHEEATLPVLRETHIARVRRCHLNAISQRAELLEKRLAELRERVTEESNHHLEQEILWLELTHCTDALAP